MRAADERAAAGAPAASVAARRALAAVFSVFAINGFMFASWVSRLPATRDALELDPATIGLVLFVGAAGSIIALPLTGAVVERIGTATTTRTASLLCAAGFGGVALALLARSPVLLAAALFVATTGMGAWDVSMNLQGTLVERAVGRAIMPRLHAGFSLGTVAGAVVGTLAAAAHVPVHVQVVVVVALCVLAVFALVALYLPDAELRAVRHQPEAAARRRGGAFGAWLERRTVLIGLMVLAAALTEGAAIDWMALAVVDGFEVTDALGAVAFGTFVSAMTLTRFAGTRALDRFGRVVVLRSCASAAVVGLVLFTLAPSLPLALLGAAAWGVGAALGFPVGMSAAADDPVHAAARVSVVSSIGYVAFLAGPPLIGLLAADVGYRNALLVIAAPLVATLLLSPVAKPLEPHRSPVGRGGLG